MNNFGGTWTGSYQLRACDQSGSFAGWCRGLGGVGTVLPVSLALTQSGNDRTQIAGTMSLGSITGNVSGNVTGDGRLVIGGSFLVNSGGLNFRWEIGGWDTRLISPGQMSGRWAQNLTAIGSTGNAYMESQIVSMAQTSATAVVIPAPATYNMTIGEAALRMQR